MLSRNCDGCAQLQMCRVRFKQVELNEKVYCPDGTVHLVDQLDEQAFVLKKRNRVSSEAVSFEVCLAAAEGPERL